MAMRDIHMQLPEERIEDFERIQELVEYRTKAEVVASAGRLVRHICEEIYKARRTGDNLQLCLVKNRNADEVKRINSSFLDRIR